MKQDVIAGATLSAIGIAAILEGRRHHIGTLREMQAGYFPIMLGILMLAIGVMMAVAAWRGGGEAVAGHRTDWRGFSAIVAAVAAFIGLGALFGLAPATFCCVLIAARGDRTISWRASLVLAAGMTGFAVVLFAWLLAVPFPVLQWPS